MKILGIETSCDDTGIAVLKVSSRKSPRFLLLSNVLASQIKVHQKYGGVYPLLAKREHEKNLPIVLKKALVQAKTKRTDAIAITYGPGLSPCLWTGVNFAKELANKWGVPLIPINHIEGHLLIALFHESRNAKREIQRRKTFGFEISDFRNIFPAVALIVSGGHTQLILVEDIGKYTIRGETRDDAAGECFDKTARILGLEYPGGPAIAREAQKTNFENRGVRARRSPDGTSPQLPRPMMHTKDYDFSFSGLKTAVLYDYKARPKKVRESKEYIQQMAAEIQQAIVDVLCHKTMRAAREYKAKSIILGGGVAANASLRDQLKKMAGAENIALLAPPPNLATDNGAMIALAGYFRFAAGGAIHNLDELESRPNLRLA